MKIVKLKTIYKQKGSILAELMFGLSISLLTLLCVSIITLKFDSQKKSDTSLNSTISSASSAILTIRQDAKNAGYGLTNPAILGCKVNAYNSSLTTPAYTYELYPVRILKENPSKEFDNVSFMSSSSDLSLSPATLNQNMPSTVAEYYVNSSFGFNKNDFILLSQPSSDCTLAQITDVKNVKPYSLEHSASSKYNSGGGNSSIVYLNGAKVTNLGTGPQTITYHVKDNRLFRQNVVTGEEAIILENVFGFKVLYGVDNGTTNPKINWVDNIANTTDYSKVVAVKIGVLVRSPAIENSNGSTCQTTVVKSLEWFTDLTGAKHDLQIPTTADASCYRYRVFSSTVPLRNIIWSSNIK